MDGANHTSESPNPLEMATPVTRGSIALPSFLPPSTTALIGASVASPLPALPSLLAPVAVAASAVRTVRRTTATVTSPRPSPPFSTAEDGGASGNKDVAGSPLDSMRRCQAQRFEVSVVTSEYAEDMLDISQLQSPQLQQHSSRYGVDQANGSGNTEDGTSAAPEQTTKTLADGVTAATRALYRANWSHVVLGTTSGLLFVLVLFICYALYVLVTPYYHSITSGILLSIVTHPRSRLRSVLYMGTAVTRMSRVQQQWAVRGWLLGVIGSWLSLGHFAAFVLMQVTFFLGLNKIRVAEASILLGDEEPMSAAAALTSAKENTSAGCGGVSGAASRASSPAGAATSPSTSPAGAQRVDTERATANTDPLNSAVQTGSTANTFASDAARKQSRTLLFSAERSQDFLETSSVMDAAPPPAEAAPWTPSIVALTPPSPVHRTRTHRRRLVTTARGRRVLRYLTLGIIAFFAHLLLGITYLVLLHLLLLVAFAVVVPFCSPEWFVMTMGRLWKVSLAAFFIVGLALNLSGDILSITHAVQETTSALVQAGSSSVAGGRSGSHVASRLDAVAAAHSALPAAMKLWENENTAAIATDAMATPTPKQPAPAEKKTNNRSAVKVSTVSTTEDKMSDMIEALLSFLSEELKAMELSGSAPAGTAAEGNQKGTAVSKPPLSLSTQLRHMASLESLKNLFYSSLVGSAAQAGGSNESIITQGMPIDWSAASKLLESRLLPVVQFVGWLLVRLTTNMLDIFDCIYALMLFVLLYRYLIALDHTILYYGVAKLLRVMQPEMGDYHARNIEHDITVSFITLLQSFWHLTWFHFSVTFCAFKMWDYPTPFLQGLVSVVLALFPLVPKWMSPNSIALVCVVVRLISMTTAAEVQDAPLLRIPPDQAWTEALIFGKPYLAYYTRALSFLCAVMLECGDEWLLCVSRGLRIGFGVSASGKGREPLQPFVVGTALVLGFVAYGIRGIIFGPLTVIVARVLFDNWDIVLTNRVIGAPPPAPPTSLVAEDGDADASPSESR